MTDVLSRITEAIQNILIIAPIVLISITVHEFAHAFISYKLGDFTAKSEGRLSLNPLKHIDPIGALFFIIFRFGWAKPVPIRTLYFKNPKRDMMLTSIAGPIANILMALISVPLLALSARYIPSTISIYFILFLKNFMYMNIAFAIFNLIPIPPLDGSRVLMYFLPNESFQKVLYYERYIFIFFIFLMFTGVFGRFIGTVTGLLYEPFLWISQLILNILP